MPRSRVPRVAERVREAAAEILRAMKDPRMGFATVVQAEMSADLRYVTLFVSVFGPEAEQASTLAALEGAKGHVRTEIGRRIRLYHTPEVRFVLDSSIAHGDRIARLLQVLAAERPQGGAGPGATPAGAPMDPGGR